jgi:indole-3-glycerol phosphate synthase
MNESFLGKILANKRGKLARQKRENGLAVLKEQAFHSRQNSIRHRLRTALGRNGDTNIIAEIKRASPSKGTINEKIDIIKLAKTYRDGGAAAISVLTEEDYFQGSLQDLIDVRNAIDLPILRKDFVIDELQIYESASAGADAILLIVAALSENDLSKLLRSAEDDLGMDAIVEVHTMDELEIAKRVSARIVGINNRDLRSFKVSLNVSRELIEHRPQNTLMIAESGLSTRNEIEELASLGFDGFLIGETLMRSGDAATALAGLRGRGNDEG